MKKFVEERKAPVLHHLEVQLKEERECDLSIVLNVDSPIYLDQIPVNKSFRISFFEGYGLRVRFSGSSYGIRLNDKYFESLDTILNLNSRSVLKFETIRPYCLFYKIHF